MDIVIIENILLSERNEKVPTKIKEQIHSTYYDSSKKAGNIK